MTLFLRCPYLGEHTNHNKEEQNLWEKYFKN